MHLAVLATPIRSHASFRLALWVSFRRTKDAGYGVFNIDSGWQAKFVLSLDNIGQPDRSDEEG